MQLAEVTVIPSPGLALPTDWQQPALFVTAHHVQGGPGSNVSDYSHGTGFINWWGWDPVAPDRTYVTDVTAPVKRGATVLNVCAACAVTITSLRLLPGLLSSAQLRWYCT